MHRTFQFFYFIFTLYLTFFAFCMETTPEKVVNSVIKKNFTLLDLPKELLVYIWSFVATGKDGAHELKNSRLINRMLFDIAYDKKIWQQAFVEAIKARGLKISENILKENQEKAIRDIFHLILQEEGPDLIGVALEVSEDFFPVEQINKGLKCLKERKYALEVLKYKLKKINSKKTNQNIKRMENIITNHVKETQICKKVIKTAVQISQIHKSKSKRKLMLVMMSYQLDI